MDIDDSRRVSAGAAEDDEVFVEDADVFVENESTASVDDSAAEVVLAKNETKMVYRFRIILLVVLLLTAVMVSLTAYFLYADGEEMGFHANFESQATKVGDHLFSDQS